VHVHVLLDMFLLVVTAGSKLSNMGAFCTARKHNKTDRDVCGQENYSWYMSG